MRVIVSLLHHFRMTPDGTVYPYSVFDYTFWRRYLEVFDEVVVFGRVGKIGEVDPETMPPKSSGPGVTFFPLPDFLGAWQYLKAHRKLSAMTKQILTGSDACVLRVPSYLSMLLCREFIRTKRPYAVEVVGDPWSQLAPGSFASRLRPIIRRKWTWDMKRQCRHAAVAAYVTEYILQKRFPPGGWSSYYSSIELPASAIMDQSAIDKRIRTIDGKAKACGPWRICFVGSLWHLSKSPDILIGAVADCINKGIKLELVIVGEGKHRLQLEQQAQQLGISEYVKFTGQLSPGQPVYDQLDSSDLYVLPSHGEGLPRSIIEAFARGLPSIGGSKGGFPELLDDKHMIKSIDVPTLSGVIERTISDVEGMKQAVKRNANKATEYRTDILQKRRVELYTKLRDITQDWFDKRKGK